MKATPGQIRGHRLRAHHLDEKMPMDKITDVAGACGLQNTPPGGWETAMLNRLEGCTPAGLDDALCRDKTLMQAWSFRGAPFVFPTAESGVFLTPLIAREGEQPWIYTRGIAGALEHLHMPFDDLLARLRAAMPYLDDHTVTSKEALDQVLADIVEADLPLDRRALWRDPSMYGNPDRQTVGGAAVSFLLRPCSFASLVVFGERRGPAPTFTSFRNWTGGAPIHVSDGDRRLVRKFLHCYGPATADSLMGWLGCSPGQARRLWAAVADEIVPVEAAGKACHMLAEDVDGLRSAEDGGDRLLLLGPHDPYLDLRDRAIILEDASRHREVWKYAVNPGAVLRGGRIVGIWKARAVRGKLDVSVSVWEAPSAAERRELERLAREYAAFRGMETRSLVIDG